MNHHRDLNLSELNQGNVRTRTRKKFWGKYKEIQGERAFRQCIDCGKRAYSSERGVRIAISNVLANGGLNGEGSFAIGPYMCNHGWWHMGRNSQTLYRFRMLSENGRAAKLQAGQLAAESKTPGEFPARSRNDAKCHRST